MKLIPVYTEKSLKDAKTGKYTFWVTLGMIKPQIKKAIEKMFDVKVGSIKTLNYKGGQRKNARGRNQTVKAGKKAIVTLKDGKKIDLFEEKK